MTTTARIGFSLLTGAVMAIALLQSQTRRPVLPGDPLPGITPTEFELFRLGPAFNDRSCAECHRIPEIGGGGRTAEMRTGLLHEDGAFTAFPGGSLFHLFSIPDHRCQVHVPAEANIIARRIPTPVFGAGLVEAIPDETIASLRGEALCSQAGCASCHVPVLMTGRSSNPLFDRKPVGLLSDLLLHDGSASTPDEAIRRHSAEAEQARRNYESLPEDDRAALLKFLMSL